MINAMLVGGPLKCVTDRVPKLIKPPSSLALQRVMQRWLFVGRVEFFRTRHSSDKGIRQSRSAKPSASNNSSDVASPGRQARAPRNRLKAKRRASNINNELINALKAKAEAEVRAAKAEAEAQAANLKATAEVQAAKLKADTEVEKNNLLHSLQWYTVALAQLRGRLNMRGLLETLEDEVETRHPELKGRTRTETFKNALEHDHYKSLLRCIQTQGNMNDARKASEFLSMIYASLSRKIHNSKNAIEYQVSDDQVDIDVHALSLQEARTLACVAKHLYIPHRIVHEPAPGPRMDE